MICRVFQEPSGCCVSCPQAHFAFDSKTIYLSQATLQSSARAAFYVLSHEMVHAIQDEVAGLPKHTERQTWDEGLAERALLEGEAYFHEEHLRNMLERRTTDGWRTSFANEPLRADLAALKSAAPAADTLSLFERPYGLRFAALAFAERHAGSLARRLPLSTREILDGPDSVVASDGQHPPRSPCLRGRAIYQGHIGAWLARLWLTRSSRGSEHAATSSLGLSSESFQICEASEERAALLWRFVFANEGAATAAASNCDGSAENARCIQHGRELALVAGPERSFTEALAAALRKEEPR